MAISLSDDINILNTFFLNFIRDSRAGKENERS